MKSLATLIKLQKTLVDEQQLHLSKLQAHLVEIESKIAELEITITREQIAAQENPESQITFGAFIQTSVQLGRIYEKERQVAMDAVNIAHNKLSELFEEQKRYEIAEETRLENQRNIELHRETKQMDEIGNTNFTRSKKK